MAPAGATVEQSGRHGAPRRGDASGREPTVECEVPSATSRRSLTLGDGYAVATFGGIAFRGGLAADDEHCGEASLSSPLRVGQQPTPERELRMLTPVGGVRGARSC